MIATLFVYLAIFIVMLLVFQIIFFEVSRSRALKVGNYEWFANLNKPFNYTRTGTMIFICFICYLFGGSDTSSTLEWVIYLIIFCACGVIADAVTQFLLQKYGQIRCKKQLETADKLDVEFDKIKEGLTDDENYEVSMPRYNETLIAKQYIKPEDHLAFMSIDGGQYVKNFGDYPAATFDVEPYVDTNQVEATLSSTPVRATTLTPTQQLPFKDNRMDVIFDEYANYDKNEITRVLKPGGTFIVNQYGTDNLKEFISMFMPLGMSGSWDLTNCKQTLESVGFKILEGYEDYGYIRFRNISQLHTYMKQAVPDVAENPDKYKAFYTKAINDIKEKNFFQLTTYRFLVVARH